MIGGSGEGTRRPQAALSIWGATPSVPSPEPPRLDECTEGGLTAVFINAGGGHTSPVLADGSRSLLKGASASAHGPHITKPGTPPAIQGVTAGETA